MILESQRQCLKMVAVCLVTPLQFSYITVLVLELLQKKHSIAFYLYESFFTINCLHENCLHENHLLFFFFVNAPAMRPSTAATTWPLS